MGIIKTAKRKGLSQRDAVMASMYSQIKVYLKHLWNTNHRGIRASVLTRYVLYRNKSHIFDEELYRECIRKSILRLVIEKKIDLDGDFISNAEEAEEVSPYNYIRSQIIKDFKDRFELAQKKTKEFKFSTLPSARWNCFTVSQDPYRTRSSYVRTVSYRNKHLCSDKSKTVLVQELIQQVISDLLEQRVLFSEPPYGSDWDETHDIMTEVYKGDDGKLQWFHKDHHFHPEYQKKREEKEQNRTQNR